MKRLILTGILLLAGIGAGAQEYGAHFTDSTLRLDYIFCGDANHQAIYLKGMQKTGLWAGRRKQLDRIPLQGNGQLYVKDPQTGKVLYAHSFSTLFQEWVGYPEAHQVQKAFENCFQIPFPKSPVRVEITLTDAHGRESAKITHPVDPADILIRRVSDNGARCETLSQGGGLAEAIDIVILSEGYTSAEEEKFFADVRRIWNELSEEQKHRLTHALGVYEGGGYQSKGVFRPVQECRMKINECEDFCPVCTRAIQRIIDFYTR